VEKSGVHHTMQTESYEKKHLSIILCCYNESAIVETSIEKLILFLENLNIAYEIIIIDDFSKDNSKDMINKSQSKYNKIKLICNDCNMGKGFSVRNGILNSNGEYIIFTDMDMAYSLNNMATVLSELQRGHDIVVGNRRLKDSIYTVPNNLIKYVHRRHFVGTVFNAIIRFIFGLKIRDTQSGIKGFNRTTAFEIFPKINTNRFIFDVEIFILAKYLNKSVKEIPVHLTYFSQLSTVNILKYSLSALKEILSIKIYEIRGKYSKTF
jgi:glycosyltransferase involved in cell wall biosynthesis